MAKCWVSKAMEEKIGLPNYSNVTIGPVVIAREVDDTPAARAMALQQIEEELHTDLARARVVTLEAVQAFAKEGGYGDPKS